jgi:hypothetical protein
MFGGPAPDALAALVHLLATLRDAAGNTTITGLDNTQTWDGEAYPPERFRTDAGLFPAHPQRGPVRLRHPHRARRAGPTAAALIASPGIKKKSVGTMSWIGPPSSQPCLKSSSTLRR